MGKYLKYIIIMIFSLILINCEEEIDWDLKTEQQNTIVVEGLVTNEYKIHTIKLTRPVYELNAVPEVITGAIVAVYTHNDTVVFMENTSLGYYETPREIALASGQQYHLYISIEGTEYHAIDYMPVLFNVNPLTYVLDSALYKIGYVADEYIMEGQAIMYKVYLDWSHVDGYTHLPADSCKAQLNYYSLSTIDINQAINPTKEEIRFPKGTIIIEKQYSLSKLHEDFIRSMLIESEWRGGLFDVEKANVRGNISNGAFGFFGTSAVKVDTILVE